MKKRKSNEPGVPGNFDPHFRSLIFTGENCDNMFPDLPIQNFEIPNNDIEFIEFRKKPTPGKFSIGHFFIDDRHFWPLWKNPEKYVEKLKQFDCICSPDFSLYTDDFIAIQLYSIYQNRWLTNYWHQIQNLNVVITAQWGIDYKSEFMGIPYDQIFTIDTPSRRTKEGKEIGKNRWLKGVNGLLTLKPKLILIQGELLESEKKVFEDTKYLCFPKIQSFNKQSEI